MTKTFILTISVFIILTGFSNIAFAVSTPNSIPQNFQQAQDAGKKILFGLPDFFKGVVVDIYNAGVWAIEKFIDFWKINIQPWLVTQWGKVKVFFNQQVEQRAPGVVQQANQEKQDIKQEFPQIQKTISDWVSSVIKWWNSK